MSTFLAVTQATALTWAATAAGAGLVFVTPRLPRRALGALLAIAAVLMSWAAVAGLLAPALEGFTAWWGAAWAWLAVGVAVIVGAAISTGVRRCVQGVDTHGPTLGRQLFLVMSLHHVPEGMAVGLAVTAAQSGDALASAGAWTLVAAMASHNAVEGALVSLPLRQEGATRLRAWSMGQLSGVAEVAGAFLGAAAVTVSSVLLPWGLGIAAGAMLAVVLADLLPEVHRAWVRPSVTT